jgi:hypothetical protein
MKISSNIILFSILLYFLITSCKKENETDNIPKPIQNPLQKYVIYLSNDTITKYIFYKAEILQRITTITKTGSIVNITTFNADSDTTFNTKYFLNPSGLADSLITYNYTDSAIIESEVNYFSYNADGFILKDSTYSVTAHYNYPPGNSIYLNSTVGIYITSVYGNIQNRIDITHLDNGITGRKYPFLFETISVFCGCFGPNPSAYSDTYSYVLNANGYVMERNELESPGHPGSEPSTTYAIKTLYEYH